MIERFLNYLVQEKRNSIHTVEAYKNDLIQFRDFMSTRFENDIHDATHPQVRSWLVEMKENGLSHKTIHRKISSINAFYKYLRRIEKLDMNPVRSLKLPKIEKRLPVYVKESEMHSMKEAIHIHQKDFSEARDELVVLLLYSTGIRRSELIGLKIADAMEGTIKVLGKRNKERMIPIIEEVQTKIRQYKEQRELQNFEEDNEYLIVTNKGKKSYEKFVYGIVNKYLSKVSSAKRKSPHVLRHSFATQMLDNGSDLNAIKDLLGHSSLAATQVYTHNSIEKIKKVYQSAHPRSTKN